MLLQPTYAFNGFEIELTMRGVNSEHLCILNLNDVCIGFQANSSTESAKFITIEEFISKFGLHSIDIKTKIANC